MFKRKLFKRALPIILSVAMMFESMPATALASEATETAAEAETTVVETEAGTTDLKEPEGEEESKDPLKPEEETEGEETQEQKALEGKTEPTEGSREETEPSGTAENSESSNASTEEGITGEDTTEKTTEEGTASETEDEKTATTEASISAADEEGDAASKKYETEIRLFKRPDLSDQKVDKVGSFTHVLEGEGADHKFSTEYTDPSQCGDFVEKLKQYIKVFVDNESVDKDDLDHSITDRLEFEWKAEKDGAYSESVTGAPIKVGNYELTIKLPAIDNLCKETTAKVYVNIEKAALKLDLSKITVNGAIFVEPGTTVEEFTKDIENKYELRYSEDSELLVNKDAVKTFAVSVHESNASEDAPLAADAVLSVRKDYIVHITVEMNDESCYNVAVDEAYNVKVGELQKTRVEVKLDKEAYTAIYGDADLASLIKPESGYPKVFVLDKDGDDAKELTSADETASIAELGWYRREQDNKYDNWPTSDEITDATVRYKANEQIGWKYVKLDDVPTEAGDYYLIWKYAGDEENAYEQSVSSPVSFTLEPAPVVITIAQDEATLGKMFYEGMKQEDVKKVLSQIEYKVSTVNKEGVVDAASDIKTDTFFGTGYVGDAQEDSATGNFKPLFELQRRVKAEKKNGTMTPVEEKEEDWESPYVDGELIKKDDDHEYQYRIKFTGDKVLYGKNGEIASQVSVTQLSTDSADRNHLAKVDAATLAANARKFDIEAATEAVINTEAIINEFNGKTNSKNTGDGTLEKPAVKIYDENALFADRASYKKATVTANGASVSGNLKYTWRRAGLEDYEKYMEETEEDKKANPFDKRITDDEGNVIWSGFGPGGINTSVDDGSLLNDTADAKLYELTISFNDETNTYRAKDAKLYFVVEPQQIIIAPGEQVAQDGQLIGRNNELNGWLAGNAGNASLDKTLYTVYRLPNNDRAEFDAATDKAQYEIVLRMDKESEPVVLSSRDFFVMNKEKGADGKEVYVDTKHDVFNKAEYTYGVTARIRDKYSNYTSVDKANSVGGETKYHDLPGEIKFLGDGTLYPSIDKEALKSLTKWYDGNPITLPEGLIKLYSDKEMTKEVKDLLNTTAEYDPAKVNVYWLKKGTGKYYSTEDVVWGGDYALVLRFKGNDEYKPLRVDNEGSELGESYNEWVVLSNDDDYMFSIKRLAITIAPELKSEADIKAGDTVDTLLQKQLVVTGVLPKDEVYFQYAENKKELLERYWTSKVEKGVTTWYQVDASVEENKDLKDGWWGYSYELDKWGGYPAFGGSPNFIFQVDDKDVIQEADRQYLRYNKKYTVNFATQIGLIGVLDDSYEVTYLSASQNVINRGQGEVRPADGIGVGEVALRYDYDGKTYSIRPLEAIPYNYEKSGNYIAFRIYAPKEFAGDIRGTDFNENSKKFIYEKAIKEIGGEVIEGWQGEETGDNMAVALSNYFITVLLPVTEDDKERSFDITWEDGYTDTFKLVNAELEADLKEAVAPKSIAFNGVQSKMAVGETQQLDVKITKAQLGDVVKVQYRIAGTTDQTKNEFISIDPDTGVVTALHTAKKATTQIEAYPVYRDKTGKLVEITGKKVKKAKTKITVTNVGVPTIKKVISKDVVADVQFKEVADGYRREIYVVEAANQSAAKKMKPAQFESMIAGVKNGLYKEAGFALNPIYDPEKTAYYDSKAKAYTKTIGERDDRYTSSPEQLIPGKAYAVYVRNVSAPRTLDDGSVVDLAYNGSVKSFVATKSQVQSLHPYFQVNDDNTPVAKSAVKYLVTGYNEDGTEIFDKDKSEYQVDLFSKSAQVSLDGLFWDAEGGNDAAELQDQLRFALPLTKDKQARYLNPKLTYGIFDTKATPNMENGKFTTPVSKYATINKKGKITLKGVDLDGEKTVYVWVFADNGEAKGSLELTIKADASSVTGKKVKLNVGETKPLSDFLDYKQGKKKVPNYISTRISISDETIQSAAAAGYKIEDGYDRYVETLKSEGHYVNEYYDWDEKPEYHYWYITAVSPNKQAFTLNFTDRQNNGTDITVTKPVTLTSTVIQPVKNLKVSYVDDKNITINFKHTGNPQGYEIAVVDARKNVIEKKYIDAKNYDIVKKDAKPYLQNYQKWMVNEDGRFDHELVYFEKTKTYAYTISNPKLLRLSTYTVSVTPVYENQRPKAVSKKVKTTNIPAASWSNVDVQDPAKGGMSIYYIAKGDGVFEQAKDENGKLVYDENGNPVYNNCIEIWQNPYFQAGNVYTLRAAADDDAKNRVTDTLTWKSSNTKVATIKANAGKYTATFKPLKAGETTISVTSKITKKVIARWDVKVKAIGNGEGFGGDYEPTDRDPFYGEFLAKWDPFYAGRLEVLSVTNPLTLKLKAYERVWVTFTAPTFGQYDFNEEFDGLTIKVYDSKTSSEVLGADSDTKGIFLEAGQKVYMSVETPEGGTFRLSAKSTNFARMTEKNDSIENAIVVADEWVAFTAPEENYYSFITDDKTGATPAFRKDNAPKTTNDTEFVTDDKNVTIGKAYKFALKAGETIFIKAPAGKLWVTYRKTELKLDTEKNKTQTVKISKDALTQFVKFTAPVAGRYDFTVSYDKLIKTELFTARGNSDQIDKGSFEYETAVNTLAADGDDANKPVEKKVSVYMSIGDTLIFSFKVDDVTTLEEVDKDGKKTGNYKTPEATVSVAAPTVNELKVNTEASAAKATDTAATVTSFKFEIPKDANVQYAFVLSGITANYYDEEGRALNEIKSFVVKADGTVDGITLKNDDPAIKADAKLKAGAKIFVEATNESKDNEGKIEVVQVKADMLEADKEREFNVSDKNNGFWYTFTAPAEGVYEFMYKVHDNADTTKGKHSVSFDEYDELFGKRLRTLANEKVMMANETIVIYVKANSENNAELTTKVTLTATTRKPTEIKLGKNETAELAKAGEKAYYKFTAPANDNYSFEWANAENVTSTVTMGESLKEPSVSLGDAWLNAGEVRYIKVVAATDKAKGSITVTGKKDSSVLLESGKAEPFEIKADDTNTIRRFRFTAARDNDTEEGTEYSVITTVDEGKADPTITFNGDPVDVPAGKITLKKGQTITIELTGTDTKGNIKVQPIVPAAATPITAATTTVKTSAGEYAFYSYKVPKYGRYHFEVTTEGENSAWIYDSYKNSNKLDKAADGGLYDTNDVIYFVVATGNVKEQTATLKVEEITAIAEADKAIDNVTIAPYRYVYYVFTAPEHAYYDFTKMEATEGKNIGEVAGVYRYNDKNNSSLGTSRILLDKDDKVLIKLTAKVADVQFKYTVEKKSVNVLTLDTASTLTIKAGESASFEFPVKSEGFYAFSIAGKGMNVSGLARNSRTIIVPENKKEKWFEGTPEDAHYIVNEYSITNASDTFTVTNTTDADAPVTVKVTKVEPKKLTADADTELSITKGECAIVSFVPTVSARYAFTTGNDNVKLYNCAFEEKVLDKNASTYKTMVLYVTDNEKGDNKSETTKVKVTTVKPTEITGSQTYTATGAKMTYWYEFKASNNAKYEFELNNGKADTEKAPIDGTISKYEELRKETHTTLTSELMKAGDKILVKVEIPASVAKDTSVKLDIKETKVDDFKEVVFTETSGDTKESGYFVAKKDESYTVTIVNKGNAEATAVAEYTKDKEEQNEKITFNGKQAVYKFVNDTEADIDVNVLFTLKVAKSEISFYVFVEKDPKPASAE